mmetsp:Transcript_64312/g.171531  ORF Transcript_64312/g.171531 Transcript_64312/m.171531 type:complete len:170 (-) Transcript_64312:239-748(-)
MREYAGIVEALEDLFESDDEGDGNVPEDVRQQLAEQLNLHGGGVLHDETHDDIFAAARGGSDVSGLLSSQRELAAQTDEEGLTPLHHAVDAENTAAVDALLEVGASVDARDGMQSTPLHYAAMLGATAVAQRLLKAGADPKLLDEDGKSAAAIARGEGHGDLADLLEAA